MKMTPKLLQHNMDIILDLNFIVIPYDLEQYINNTYISAQPNGYDSSAVSCCVVPSSRACVAISVISSGVFRDLFSSDTLFLEFLRLRGFRFIRESQLPFGTKVVHSFDFESRYSMVFKNVFPKKKICVKHLGI